MHTIWYGIYTSNQKQKNVCAFYGAFVCAYKEDYLFINYISVPSIRMGLLLWLHLGRMLFRVIELYT